MPLLIKIPQSSATLVTLSICGTGFLSFLSTYLLCCYFIQMNPDDFVKISITLSTCFQHYVSFKEMILEMLYYAVTFCTWLGHK